MWSDFWYWPALGLICFVLLFFVLRPSRRRDKTFEVDQFAGLRPPELDETALRAARTRFRDAGISIRITPRQLAHINTQRRLRGKSPLNAKGFSHAIANAPLRTSQSSNWFTYLILYQILFFDHAGPGPMTSIEIKPDEPFNGQGGSFGGGGASGDWGGNEQPATPAPLAGAGVSAFTAGAVLAGALDPLSNPDSYKGGDPAPDPIATGDLPSGSAMSKFLSDPGAGIERSYQNGPAPFDEPSAPRSEPAAPPAPESRPDPAPLLQRPGCRS